MNFQRKDITPIAFAVAYMDVGDKDRAFEWFEKGVEEHLMFIDELKVEPMYDSLRSDPRFTALLRKMRLISPRHYGVLLSLRPENSYLVSR